MKIIIAVILCLSCVNAASDWGYDGDNGPDHWKDNYPACGGDKQSPVDFSLYKMGESEKKTKLKFTGYGAKPKTTTLTNNGHAAVLTVDVNAEVSGGVFEDDTFVPHELIFHWGENDKEGYEHRLSKSSKNPPPMEVHLVHYNKKYGDYNSSLEHDDGLAVLAFFYFISGNADATYFEKLDAALGKISQAGSSTSVGENKPLKQYISFVLNNYRTYQGSLTSPPCSEIVTWLVFTHPVKIHNSLMKKFRSSLNDSAGKPLTRNFRPLQGINGRNVTQVKDF